VAIEAQSCGLTRAGKLYNNLYHLLVPLVKYEMKNGAETSNLLGRMSQMADLSQCHESREPMSPIDPLPAMTSVCYQAA
jgi:hypothetical protein